MNTLSYDSWKRRGSSIVYNHDVLFPLIQQGFLLPLRQVLSWKQQLPAGPPGQTILIGGLETCLEVLSKTDGEYFLRHEVKPLIRRIQDTWDQCGVVFGFGKHEKAFEVNPTTEEILFYRNAQQQVRLSYMLWDGSSTLDVRQILTETEDNKQQHVGFYVQRIS